jgi:hypothetical protein
VRETADAYDPKTGVAEAAGIHRKARENTDLTPFLPFHPSDYSPSHPRHSGCLKTSRG